jgi:hypothetical protein
MDVSGKRRSSFRLMERLLPLGIDRRITGIAVIPEIGGVGSNKNYRNAQTRVALSKPWPTKHLDEDLGRGGSHRQAQ